MSPAERKTYTPASWYVNADLYARLQALSEAWRTTAPVDLEDARISALLLREARLLDLHAYDEWLELYLDECVYWIPAAWPASDPGDSITLEFHDRRRLIDRITRLRTGVAYSQVPPSRTSRVLGSPELWQPAEDQVLARASFTLSEHQSGRNRTLAGWYGYALRRVGADWRIEAKQINLLDCDQPQGNNSFFL